MSKAQKQPDEPMALKALERAARQALEDARKNGTPCYVWRDGKIIDIAARPKLKSSPKTRTQQKPSK